MALSGAVLTPAAVMYASAAPLTVRLYIAGVSTLVLLLAVALVVGLTRETMRGLRRMQVVLRARRRLLTHREPVGVSAVPA